MARNLGDKGARAGAQLAILLVLSCLAWRSVNYVSGMGYGIDSGVFASSARHLLAGKVLYRDIFDHKPPLVHFIDAMALGFGDGTIDSIRFAERIFAVAGVLLFYFITLLAFGSRAISFVSTLAFHLHFYHPSVFEGGNLTEEYGSVFALAGMLFALLARNARGGNFRFPMLCSLSGMSFSLAALTKEPFLFTAIPWFFFLALSKPEEIPGRGGVQRFSRARSFRSSYFSLPVAAGALRGLCGRSVVQPEGFLLTTEDLVHQRTPITGTRRALFGITSSAGRP